MLYIAVVVSENVIICTSSSILCLSFIDVCWEAIFAIIRRCCLIRVADIAGVSLFRCVEKLRLHFNGHIVT